MGAAFFIPGRVGRNGFSPENFIFARLVLKNKRMGRILAIDYGTKRTGVAATDPLRIIANGLGTFATDQVLDYLIAYFKEEEVDCIVVGDPRYPDGNPAQLAPQVAAFAETLRRTFPGVAVVLHDERFTSEEAKRTILAAGLGKMKRRDKSLVDKVSAVIILQDYLEHIRLAPVPSFPDPSQQV